MLQISQLGLWISELNEVNFRIVTCEFHDWVPADAIGKFLWEVLDATGSSGNKTGHPEKVRRRSRKKKMRLPTYFEEEIFSQIRQFHTSHLSHIKAQNSEQQSFWMFWCWLSAKKEGSDCEEQSLPTIHQVRAMVVLHHHRKNKNSLWINIIQCPISLLSSQKPTSAWGQVRLCSLEGILAFPDCPYPLSWGSITETPSIVLIIGRRKRQKIPGIFHHHHSWKKCPYRGISN